MPIEFFCQTCGQPVSGEHNCNGRRFRVASMEADSIPAEGEQRILLQRKGFRESFGPYGVYYYHHPMLGLLFLYPGAFAGTVPTAGMPLQQCLSSLCDSSYTDLDAEPTQGSALTRCDACGEVGPLLPDDSNLFPHRAGCPQQAVHSHGKHPLKTLLS